MCHGIFLSLEKGLGFQGPSKVAFFVWHALNGKILTVNLIKKKQVHINWCCMSKKDRILLSHLLSHCEVARELWSLPLL